LKPYYDDGNGIVIYHGDSLDVLPEMPLCDLVLTDPPFFMPAQHYNSRANWQRSWGDTSVLGRWFAQVIAALIPRMNPTARILSFCDDESYPVFYPELYRRFDTLASLVWDKSSIGMGSEWRHSHELIVSARWKDSAWHGAHALSDVLRVKNVPSAQRLHPVDKPTDLLRQLLAPTTREGDLVLDPFMGGGSTLLAARLMNRRAVGIELDEKYCEIAATRLSQSTLLFGEATA
jgi:site-specific DNA-methyltransferase (adenine-specific)